MKWWTNLMKVATIENKQVEVKYQMAENIAYVNIGDQFKYVVDNYKEFDEKRANAYLDKIVKVLEKCNNLAIIKCFSQHYRHSDDLIDCLLECYIKDIKEWFWEIAQMDEETIKVLKDYINYNKFVDELEREGNWERIDDDNICYVG